MTINICVNAVTGNDRRGMIVYIKVILMISAGATY